MTIRDQYRHEIEQGNTDYIVLLKRLDKIIAKFEGRDKPIPYIPDSILLKIKI